MSQPFQAASLSLAARLFGSKSVMKDVSWDSQMFESTSSTVHSGLDADKRKRLLTMFEVKGDLTTLSAPKLSKVAFSRTKLAGAKKRRASSCVTITDLQYRFSLHRRAFINLSPNLLGKTTAVTSLIDEWLFGATFAENIKDAQSSERTGRGLLKCTPAASG
ncbi:hypothetical protein ALC62_01826 [Cyphomyrmex costatus]|uniref:Uncharacterized protein n=1 Tax=Cyphomyrmex costatus TaxID=456900 RepID=A0A151IP11_9HYME|nr:hypothetical protein ALC62_01826 [Cyphomyrmex costatus]